MKTALEILNGLIALNEAAINDIDNYFNNLKK